MASRQRAWRSHNRSARRRTSRFRHSFAAFLRCLHSSPRMHVLPDPGRRTLAVRPSSLAGEACRTFVLMVALFPRLSARSPFPHSLAGTGLRADLVHRLLLLARFQKVIQGFGAKRWINEQLSRPPLLNLTAENDVHFR